MTRTSQIRKIHVGCRQMGISSDDRHTLQLRVVGKESLKDMTESELALVVKELVDKGFKSGFKPGAKGRKHATAPRADLRYVHVLWRLLGDAGALKKPGREGLNAFVRARFEAHWETVPIDIDALRNAGQINDVTRALKDWCARSGVSTERPPK